MQTHGWYKASFLLVLKWAGWCFGQRHVQTGVELQRNLARRLKDAFFRCHYVSAFQLADTHLDATLDLMCTCSTRLSNTWTMTSSPSSLSGRATLS
jgi:hypothetical protein